MKLHALVLAILVCTPVLAQAGSDDSPAAAEQQTRWSAWGGTVGVRWMDSVMNDMGITISSPQQKLPANAPRLTDHGVGVRQARGLDLFELRRSGSIEFKMAGRSFDGFVGGSLQARGGYVLTLNTGEKVDLRDFRLRPHATNRLRLELVDADGKAWFYIDRMMYQIEGKGSVLAVYTADLRASAELVRRTGYPELADHPVADLEIIAEVVGDGLQSTFAVLADPVPSHWHGDPVPGQPAGTIYQADLFMQSFSVSRMRQSGVTGPDGSGRVVFAPSSTLKNNVNNGTAAVTISGQGTLGTSNALWTADIPWRAKFSGVRAPYANDQHPYLIWNMYRVNADGGIEQIGRSGVKHAWLTTNGGCAPGENHDGAILGRQCSDTYSTGNNDANDDLGFRSEIIPSTNEWGRCGSIHDPDCNGSENAFGDDGYVRRLVVTEPQLSATVNPGATFYFDSWYLARQDVNIYNSMATVTGTPTFTNGNWNFSSQANYRLGSVTDRWTETLPANTVASNVELASTEGHAKVAVRVTDLGNGEWRYHYAVHNLDFSRARTEGTTPNLRLLSNKGFSQFSVPLPAGVNVVSNRFSDGTPTNATPWTFSSAGGSMTWTAPPASLLEWGSLYLFSVVLDAPPVDGDTSLQAAEGTPASFSVRSLIPDAPANDLIFADGFDPTAN